MVKIFRPICPAQPRGSRRLPPVAAALLERPQCDDDQPPFPDQEHDHDHDHDDDEEDDCECNVLLPDPATIPMGEAMTERKNPKRVVFSVF